MNMGVPAAASWASWAPNEDLQHAAKAPGLSVPFVADHRRAKENGGEKNKEGKGRGRQKSTVVGKIRRPTSAKGRRLKAMHAVSCIDIGPFR